MQLAILGRQPKISLAELESLFGGEKITEISDEVALIDVAEPLPQSRLGGTMKSAKVLTRLDGTDLPGAFSYLQKTVTDHLQHLPEGKLQLGVSVYGFDASAKSITKQVLSLKKTIKNTGRSVRILENKKPALESAQVLYNKLTGPLGWELLLVKDGNDVILAQTTGVQNVDDYSKRDFDRPKRDAYVGMLPPKLAQIMINLAVGNKTTAMTVLDPFCGTGVVLQEALLMDMGVYGTDIEPRMIEYTKANLEYIAANQMGLVHLEVGDAKKHQWEARTPGVVVAETYLGKPLTSLPGPDKLDKIINEANEIAKEFLKNIHPQLKKGTRLCLALPAWHLGNGKFKHLPVLDQIANLGYNRLDLKHATREDLIYHRKDQVVARELTILEKV